MPGHGGRAGELHLRDPCVCESFPGRPRALDAKRVAGWSDSRAKMNKRRPFRREISEYMVLAEGVNGTAHVPGDGVQWLMSLTLRAPHVSTPAGPGRFCAQRQESGVRRGATTSSTPSAASSAPKGARTPRACLGPPSARRRSCRSKWSSRVGGVDGVRPT